MTIQSKDLTGKNNPQINHESAALAKQVYPPVSSTVAVEKNPHFAWWCSQWNVFFMIIYVCFFFFVATFDYQRVMETSSEGSGLRDDDDVSPHFRLIYDISFLAVTTGLVVISRNEDVFFCCFPRLSQMIVMYMQRKHKFISCSVFQLFNIFICWRC